MGTTRYNKYGFKDYNYNKDIQGSTTSVVGQGGTSQVTYGYDDFGVKRSIGDSTFFNEICYTGDTYDVSTGLYYLNARYYDPKNGRFITKDTYRGETNEPDTLHLYAYCANNPINYVEPSGHMRIRKWIAARAATYFSGKAAKYYVKKLLCNKGRIKRQAKKYFRKFVSARVAAWAMGAFDFLLIVYGTTVGDLIVNAIDRYIDPKLGYRGKRNNHNYIFG